jgi:FkbM family methyltransferase
MHRTCPGSLRRVAPKNIGTGTFGPRYSRLLHLSSTFSFFRNVATPNEIRHSRLPHDCSSSPPLRLALSTFRTASSIIIFNFYVFGTSFLIILAEMLSKLLVNFYNLWHGKLHLRGAGLLLRFFLPYCPGLYSFRLKLAEGHYLPIDFRDVSAIYWLHHLLREPFEEEGLLASVVSQAKDGDIIWDIGANCGLFSYRLAKESKAKEIYFFEPNPQMYSLASIACSPFEKVRGLDYALSDHSGPASLTIPQGASTTGTMEVDRTERIGNSISIKCITGDELLGSGTLNPPRIIKIDTEGHEISVIRGLQETISTHKPIIFFEHISVTDEEIKGIIPEDYDIYSVDDVDGALELGFNRAKGHNSALIPK